MPSLVACAMDSCKWNRDGQCNKSEIFVDGGTTCASFEPNMGATVGPQGAMVGPQGADPRAALLQMLAGGGGPPGPPMGGPPVGRPPMGASPMGMPGLPPSQI